MNHAQQKHYQALYKQHVNALICQGKAEATIDVYSRAVRRITESFDLCPDTLTQDHLETYFTALIKPIRGAWLKPTVTAFTFFTNMSCNNNGNGSTLSNRPSKKSYLMLSYLNKSNSSLIRRANCVTDLHSRHLQHEDAPERNP